jgi:hypothetical protein
MPVPDAEQRQKMEAALILKATEVVGHMRRIGQTGTAPDQVEKIAEALESMVKTKEFPSARSADFREVSKLIQRSAFQLSVDKLLGEAEDKARNGDDKARNETLTKAKEHFGKAVRLGADEEFRAGVERRVQQVLMTSKKGVDDRTKQAAQRKLDEAASRAGPGYKGVEHRRARRYGDPALEAVIDGRRYTTVNWSTRGLLLEPTRPEAGLQKGAKVKIELTCPGNRGGGKQTGRIVRVDEQRFAVDFGEISTVILDLMHHLRQNGIQPEAER